MHKRSNFLWKLVNYGEKSFITLLTPGEGRETAGQWDGQEVQERPWEVEALRPEGSQWIVGKGSTTFDKLPQD